VLGWGRGGGPRQCPTKTAPLNQVPTCAGSDEEIEIAGSDTSLGSSISSLSDVEYDACRFWVEGKAVEDGAVDSGQQPAVAEKVDARKLRCPLPQSKFASRSAADR